MSERKFRGLTQNLYLVKLDITNRQLVFHVLGTSHIVYKITCVKNQSPKCTCPDYKIRKNICKHIYFVCDKVMQVPTFSWEAIEDVEEVGTDVLNRLPNLHVTDEYYTSKYDQILKRNSKQTAGKDENDNPQEKDEGFQIRNEDCCVCLGEIENKSSKEVMVCTTCHNGIHSICWKKWNQVNSDNRCVYCRTKVEKSSTDRGTNLERSGWGVLLE